MGGVPVDGEGTRYRFGPLERRGLVAGWRGGQIASVAGGLVVAVLVLRSRPTAASVAVALVTVVGGIALACWPVAGRTGEEWLPTVARWEVAGLSRSRCRRSGEPRAGHCVGPDGVLCGAGFGAPRPVGRRRGTVGGGPFGELSLLVASGGIAGAPRGVVFDRRAGTYTAVLALRGHSFALLGPAEKERRVAGWAGVLASLSRAGSIVHRVQWLAGTLPDDGRAVRGDLAQRAVLAEGSAARRSYELLLDGVGASTCRHEAHLAVQVSASGPGGRAVRAAGGGHTGGCAVVLRETEVLGRLLTEADVVVDGVLAPRALVALIRRSGEGGPLPPGTAEPGTAQEQARAGAGRGCAPCADGRPWPMATEAEWGCLRADGAWHASYWISEWPRVDVGADFLAPLLLGPHRRTVSVVMEPLSPDLAIRQVEQARTADLADSELRRRGGFLPTARRAREEDLVARREEELADGHASLRFSGYVTVTAPTRELLEDACEAAEQAAGQCRLELRRLYGDQDRGFATSLPLCRGLA